MLNLLPFLFPFQLMACFLIGGTGPGETDSEHDETGEPDGTAVDILLVMDNSISMQPHADALSRSLEHLEAGLTAAGMTDWQIGVTTSSVYFDEGPTPGIDSGEAGTLVGGAMLDSMPAVQEALLCEATCWASTIPTDLEYDCGDPLEGPITKQYLDCLCGTNQWQGHCGSGMEQPLEAAFMALCRGVETPPDDCFDFPDGAAVVFEEGDEQTNAGLQSSVDTLVVVFTDEGDSSLRTTDGEAAGPGDVQVVVDEYVGLYAEFPNPVGMAIIGPAWDGWDDSCLNGAQESGVDRFLGVSDQTGGFYEFLTEIDRDCTPRSFETMMDRVVMAAAE